MQSPIFLIGTQRSGTTLLGKMLSAHKEIFIKNEVRIRHVFTPGATRKEIECRIDKSVENRFGVSIKDLLKKEGKSIWGLKDPQLTEHLESLKQFLPEARFIIITRDARAVVRSYIENAWGLGTNCYTGAQRWKREIEIQLAFQKELPEYVLQVRFEDLILNQKESLQKICEFIKVPFDESMLNYASKKSFVSKNRQSINTFRDPDPSVLEKWREGLNEHQIKVINTVCGDSLEELGYSVADNFYNIPEWLKLYYNIHQSIIGEIQIQYRLRFVSFIRSFKKMFSTKSHQNP
jgi:hypothetical protein